MTYHGWPNYPTWAVYTHLTLNENTHRATRMVAKHGANVLRTLAEDIAGIDLPPLAKDLVDYALGEVDWQALIKAFLEE